MASKELSIDGVEYPFYFALPPALKDKVEAVEVEFVHDGKGKASLPAISGAAVTERVQQGAPPHAIVCVRSKRPERDPNTRVRGQDRLLDATGNQLSYTANNVPGLALNERHSIPLLGVLPQGDAPRTLSEGSVTT